MTLVKICGIRELAHARVAAQAGADMIGFVFVPVRREVAPDDAANILSSIRRENARPPAAIGLFVNETAETINRVVERAGLDMVQLSGDEEPDLAGQIGVPVVKVIRLQPDSSLDDARKVIQAHLAFSDAVLIDSHVAGHWGGTGVVGDWSTASSLAAEFPVVLAGGLNPDNVTTAIQRVGPAMVDVSSGVESDGRKDSARIQAFLESARAIDQTPAIAASEFLELVSNVRRARTRSGITA